MAESKQLTIRDEIDGMASQFQAALPPHIPVEKFIRVLMTAVNSNPDLAAADRRSMFEAAMKCAQDGLIPDGREAALVIFNTNAAKKGEPAKWIKKVQYLPMVWGIVKKVRNSGELTSIAANVVYENDTFEYFLGDEEGIKHLPLLKGDRGAPIMVYAIAKTKDGGIYREVMTAGDVDVIRNFSKSKDSGPWAGPFALEMWRKSAIRRLAKRLPMSTDIEQLIQRDDEMYDLSRHHQVMPRELPREKSALLEQVGQDQKADRAREFNSDPNEQPKVVESEPKQTEKQKDAAITVEMLVERVNRATAEDWDEIKSRVSKSLSQLKSASDQLEVTRAMNRKNAEVYP